MIVAKLPFSKIHITGDKILWSCKEIYFDSLHLIHYSIHLTGSQFLSHSFQIYFSLASNSFQICFKFASNPVNYTFGYYNYDSFSYESMAMIHCAYRLYKEKMRTPLITASEMSALFLCQTYCAKKSIYSGTGWPHLKILKSS